MKKILLLQGPLKSSGINFLTSELYRTPQEREKVRAVFDSCENIRALSYIFRSNGFKVVYSGWAEDEIWLNENSSLFDALRINSQNKLSSTVEFMGEQIQNNKEKLYFSIFQGLLEVENLVKNDCAVLRMRSDIAVDVKFIEKCLFHIVNYPNSIMIEYANPSNCYFVPDFLTVASLSTHKKLYSNLLQACSEFGGYHISSHIDHGIEFLGMKARGELSEVICMEREIYDSLVWRGLPRYYVPEQLNIGNSLLFNCLINYPSSDTVSSVVDGMHPELKGRPIK